MMGLKCFIEKLSKENEVCIFLLSFTNLFVYVVWQPGSEVGPCRADPWACVVSGSADVRLQGDPESFGVHPL